MALKKQFNRIKYSDPAWLDADGQPWLRTIHRDAHAQPFANLARAWSRYFEQRRAGQPAHPPVYKKKGRCRDACYVANDKFRIEGASALLPKVGRAVLREGLRIRGRRLSRKLEAAKVSSGIAGRIPKDVRLPVSKNRTKGTKALARLHARIARVRADFLHKLTTRLCRENQAVAIEDLNVRGMLANERLARAVADVGFYELRRQLQYKAARYGTTIVLADRWYPSSKLCSSCGERNGARTLGERAWTCGACGAQHDRDVNAAINLQRLATGAHAARMALPEASQALTPGTAAGLWSAGGGEVTPVRHEHGQQDGSGQEENGAYFYALFR
jgi:putative transposase